jgi:hypothetical protein
MMTVGLLEAAVALVLGYILITLFRSASGPVSRTRVERFAGRQALAITAGNGNLVIRYLRTTRRWRTLGLATGLLLTVAWSLRDSRITVNALSAFAGWFVGAMVAEYRVATLEPGARRAASLEPRLLRQRLAPAARGLPLVLGGVTLAGAACSLLAAGAGRDVDRTRVFGQVLAAVLALGLPLLVGRHVLGRPRPLAAALDQQLADDAIRDRSLHVLAGCAIALTALPAGNLMLYLGASVPDLHIADPIGVLGALLLVAGPLLGWAVATRGRPPEALGSSRPDGSRLEVTGQS